MPEVSKKDNYQHSLVILFLFFVISRLFFYLIGIRFNTSPLYWFFQFLDPHDLRSHLLQSIFFLHSQPPGFNLFLGLVLKLASGYEQIVFKTIYMLMGLFMTLSLYVILRKLIIPNGIALLLTMFFSVSPPVIFFENWLFYTYPVTFLLLVSGLLLYNYLNNHNGITIFLFFLILALIVITRSLFHPIWFIIILIGLIVYEKQNVKKILLCALFPFFIIICLFLKNYLVFNQMNLTSWFGMNLIKMTFTVPFEKISPLINNGEISDIAVIKPFRAPKFYRKYANFDTITTIPVLDKKYKSTGFVNFNHIGYKSVSQQYYSTAKYLIGKYPKYYGLSIIKAFYAYLKPCSDSIIISGNNRQKIKHWVNFYEKYLVGDILNRVWHTKFINRFGQERKIHINFLYFFIPILYCWGLLLIIKGKKIFDFNKSEAIFFKYIMFNIIYITAIGNFIEISENMRFRFLLVPFIYVLIATLFKYFIKKK